MERVIGGLVSAYRIADLTIEEPPLDEVIAAIYAAGSWQSGAQLGSPAIG